MDVKALDIDGVRGSTAFDGSGNILVTNQSFFAANANNWAVLRAWVNDSAWPLIEPDLP